MAYIVYTEYPESTGRTLTNAFTDPDTGAYYAEVDGLRDDDTPVNAATYTTARGRATRAYETEQQEAAKRAAK